jgi:hypothetical protein
VTGVWLQNPPKLFRILGDEHGVVPGIGNHPTRNVPARALGLICLKEFRAWEVRREAQAEPRRPARGRGDTAAEIQGQVLLHWEW